MVRTFFARAICLLGIGASVAQAAAPDLEVAPTEGIWWSSEAPGTGVAFNVDAQNRWFAAIYLYDEDGLPTFLTMQGNAIEYKVIENVDFIATTQEVYARVSSPLIRSEGGQCLKCPWTKATAAASGDGEAEIVFYSRNRAELRVGNWSLRLAPMVDSVESLLPDFPELWAQQTFALPSDYYSVTIETESVNSVVLAKLVPADPFQGTPPPYVYFTLNCVDCRVSDAGNNSSAEQESVLSGPLYLQSFRFVCPRRSDRLDCRAVSRIDDGEFLIGAYFSDQTGSEITVVDYGNGELRSPGKMTIRALPAGWEPTLP